MQDEKGGLSVKTLKPDDIKNFINREAVYFFFQEQEFKYATLFS